MNSDNCSTRATDVTLGASGLWLGTRTGGGSTATLTESFSGRTPWLHGQQDSLPDMLCDPTGFILRKGTPFEAMTGRTAPSLGGLLAGFLGFSSTVKQIPGDLCTAPRIISLLSLPLAIDATDVTLGASGLWLGSRTEAGGTITLA